MQPGCPIPAFRRGLTLVVALVAAQVASRADSPRFAVDRPIDMKHVRLDLSVDLPRKRVDALATLTIRPRESSASMVLDGVDLDVRSVKVGSNVARFSNSGREIEVFFDAALPAGQEAAVTIEYVVSDPKDGLHFFAPSPDDPDAPYQVWSQGQSIDNRFWIPCFDDPGERQTTELVATVESKYVVVSNGRLVETRPAGEGRTVYHWLQDQPHPIYLVSLIVGEFAVHADTWRGKPVLYYAPPSRKDDIQRSFDLTPRMLDFFSDKIGVEYPWDKYAQTCCYQFGGGMENTSATTLGEGALHDERSAIDGVSEGLIAHELAHQWWGDLLTCREWAHLWLNEGFATYFEALWDEHHNGAAEFAHNMYNKSKNAINGGKTLPIVHRGYASPNEQFDARAYPKGAWVLHMLRGRVGDELFWKVMNHYCTTHRLQSVETDDLRRAFESVTGRSFERFFYDWTERPGHPVLDVSFKWDESARMAEATIRQTQEAEAFHIPLVLEFQMGDASPPHVVQRQMTDKQAIVCVALPSRPTAFIPDPDHRVLMELTESKPRDMWLVQLGHRNPVARIRAVQALAREKSDASRAALADALRREAFWGVKNEIAARLGELGGEAARDALLEGTKDANPRTRRACVEALAAFKADATAVDALRALVAAGDPSYRVEAASIEALAKVAPADASSALRDALRRDSAREVIRSAALGALGVATDPDAIGVLIEWAARGKPRECRAAALGALGEQALRPDDGDAAVARIVEVLMGSLGDTDRRVRDAAARALGGLGKRAQRALPALRELADAPAADRSSRAARNAIERIEKDEPGSKQIGELRKQLDELRAENRKLRDQVESLEARVKADRADRPQ